MRDAERDTDDRGKDHQQQSPQRGTALLDRAVFERKTQSEHDERDGDGKFRFEIFHCGSFI